MKEQRRPRRRSPTAGTSYRRTVAEPGGAASGLTIGKGLQTKQRGAGPVAQKPTGRQTARSKPGIHTQEGDQHRGRRSKQRSASWVAARGEE